MAIVVASLRILGGQAVQAQRMIAGWRSDPDVEAWIVPINPVPRPPFDRLLRIKYVRTLVTQLLYWPLLFRELRRADVVHIFSASYSSFLLAPLPAVIAARLLGKPVVLNYHSGEAPDHLRRSTIARRTLARHVDVNVVPSAFLRDVLASFGIHAEVVSNTIDLQTFVYRVRDPLGRRLLSTRNFEPVYNVACTLRAFAIVQASHPDASLTLVGSGSQEQSLRALADRLGLRNVVFAGRVEPAEIHRYYAAADVYVQTPAIDNMPLSVIEAFASGLPVVSTRVGGVPSILADGVHGLLAPPDDAAAVAAHVIRVLDDPGYARQLAAAARDTCSAYQWPAARTGWYAAYRAAIARHRGRHGGTSQRTSPTRFGRLRQLTAPEVRWRAAEAWHTTTERLAARLVTPRWDRRRLLKALAPPVVDRDLRDAIAGGRWAEADAALRARISSRPARYALDPASVPRLRETILARWPDAARDAAERADRMLEGRYDLLGYQRLVFQPEGLPPPSTPDWHFDPVHRRRAPKAFWASVPYLDPAVGDHKIIWELNRHQHWLRYGRAYSLTGTQEYGDAIVAELASWLRENPPLVGINWASMLEAGFRSLSWTWALHCLLGVRGQGSGSPDPDPWLIDILLGLDRHLTHVERHLSYYFSPNTHLTGEALALYVVGTALPELAGSARWRETGRRILMTEIGRQIHADGGHAERSTHYQRYTLDFYLLALLTARLANDGDAARAFGDAALRLAEFTRAIADDSGSLPLIGDDDGGTLWPLTGRACRDVRDSLSLAAALFDRPALAPWGLTEEALWVGGPHISGGPNAVPTSMTSRLLPDTGYFVARDGRGSHAVLDVGRHGYMNGGHAHADALAVTLTIAGRPLLIDPGTSTYTMNPALRDRMRSTASHNTLMLDGQPQSISAGPFHWRTQAHARVHASGHDHGVDWIEAWHDGYAPMRHRRTMLRTADAGWLIADDILGSDGHVAATHWHFDPAWTIVCEAPRTLCATHEDGTRVWLLHDSGELELFRGDERTGLGWYAPVYGTLVPAWTARITREDVAPFSCVTWIGRSEHIPSIARVDTRADKSAMTICVDHDGRDSLFVLQPGSGRAPALVRHSAEGKDFPLARI